MELEKLWGSIRTSDVYDYVPEEYKQQSALPSEIYDEAFKKMKVNDIAKIQALVDREVAAANPEQQKFTLNVLKDCLYGRTADNVRTWIKSLETSIERGHIQTLNPTKESQDE